MKEGIISLNPSRPDQKITAATLVWCEALSIEEGSALVGVTPSRLVEIIESRLDEVRIEHLRLAATGQLQELIGRTDLAKIMTKLRGQIEDMSPGQLLATGSFMHQVSGLQQDRQLINKNEQPRFSIRVLQDEDRAPAGFRGLVLSFNAGSESGVLDN